MTGTLAIPTVFAPLSGNVAVSLLDTDLSTIVNYVNVREIVQDVFGNRPAASTNGRWYFATDTAQLFADNGSAWTLIAAAPASVTLNAVVIGNGVGAFNTLLLTKGQLLVGQTGAIPVALPISSDGFVLTLDSTTGAGVKWAAAGASAGGVGLGLVEAMIPLRIATF
jgi:hypothetical protein